MDLFSNLALGFATAGTPENLFFCLIGVLLGTLIGVLPGIGATATIAMLLPITFQLEPVSSLIMLMRHLLRRAVWWFHDGDPDQHAGRILFGRHRDRRLPDGPQGQGGGSACDRGARLVLQPAPCRPFSSRSSRRLSPQSRCNSVRRNISR